MRYEGIVYRPPSEAGSLIIQATIGCPHNACAFCNMYKDKRFRARPVDDVIEDMNMALAAYGPGIRTIFLADGNSAALSTEKLILIGNAARMRFPSLERITTYGSAKFLVKKSKEEWRDIAAAGITRIHSGLESGDDETLLGIRKGVTADEAARAFTHVMAAGIELSVYVMVGIAGVERTREHAAGTARVLNNSNPTFIRLRTFIPRIETSWHDHWASGKLTLLTSYQAVEETKLFIENLTGPTMILSDHFSNFVDVRGRIPEDKKPILAALDEALNWPPESFRPPTEELVSLTTL